MWFAVYQGAMEDPNRGYNIIDAVLSFGFGALLGVVGLWLFRKTRAGVQAATRKFSKVNVKSSPKTPKPQPQKTAVRATRRKRAKRYPRETRFDKLISMRENGDLTQAEFDAAKSKLIDTSAEE